MNVILNTNDTDAGLARALQLDVGVGKRQRAGAVHDASRVTGAKHFHASVLDCAGLLALLAAHTITASRHLSQQRETFAGGSAT